MSAAKAAHLTERQGTSQIIHKSSQTMQTWLPSVRRYRFSHAQDVLA